jgi:hypothetical protein
MLKADNCGILDLFPLSRGRAPPKITGTEICHKHGQGLSLKNGAFRKNSKK